MSHHANPRRRVATTYRPGVLRSSHREGGQGRGPAHRREVEGALSCQGGQEVEAGPYLGLEVEEEDPCRALGEEGGHPFQVEVGEVVVPSLGMEGVEGVHPYLEVEVEVEDLPSQAWEGVEEVPPFQAWEEGEGVPPSQAWEEGEGVLPSWALGEGEVEVVPSQEEVVVVEVVLTCQEVEEEEEEVLPSQTFLEVVVGGAGGQAGQQRHRGGVPHLVLMGVGEGGEGEVTVAH